MEDNNSSNALICSSESLSQLSRLYKTPLYCCVKLPHIPEALSPMHASIRLRIRSVNSSSFFGVAFAKRRRASLLFSAGIYSSSKSDTLSLSTSSISTRTISSVIRVIRRERVLCRTLAISSRVIGEDSDLRIAIISIESSRGTPFCSICSKTAF